MIEVRQATPGDYEAITQIWSDQLPGDWMGTHRFTQYVLTDPQITPESWWVVVEQSQVRGFLVVSRIMKHTCHVGAMAIHRVWHRQGLARMLWAHVQAFVRQRGVKHVLFDGILPHIFIPGIDRETYPAAWEWLTQEQGSKNLASVVAMARPLDDIDGWDDVGRSQLLPGDLMMGIIPPFLRGEAMQVALRHFGPGWVRALRETWLEDLRPDRVLGIFSESRVLGLSVVGGYDQPLGRLGPIGVSDALRGKGLGSRLLNYTLRYMKTYQVSQAYFLHCDVGIPAYFMYLRHGFHVTRTFIPLSLDLT